MNPGRVKQQRTRGWRKPPGAVSVVRGTKWGNPYVVGAHAADKPDAVRRFRAYLGKHPELVAEARQVLRGKVLMCWCRLDEPCHADVWLELAND